VPNVRVQFQELAMVGSPSSLLELVKTQLETEDACSYWATCTAWVQGHEVFSFTFIISFANDTDNPVQLSFDEGASWTASEAVDLAGQGEFAVDVEADGFLDVKVSLLVDVHDFGSISFRNRPPWDASQRARFAARYLQLKWAILAGDDAYSSDLPKVACRQARESATVTSTVDAVLTAEIHPVWPRPPAFPSYEGDHAIHALTSGIRAYKFEDTWKLGGQFSVAADSPINVLFNPAVIPILAAEQANEGTAARVRVTGYRPRSRYAFTEHDARLTWSFEGKDGGVVAFLEGRSTGLDVLVRGVSAGEVLLKLAFAGETIAAFRALVRPIRMIPCRFTVVSMTHEYPFTQEQLRDCVAVANRYLRQIAVEMVVHKEATTSLDFDPGWATWIEEERADPSGISFVRVKNGLYKDQDLAVPDKKLATYRPPAPCLVNARKKVVNITAFRRFKNPNVLGMAVHGSLSGPAKIEDAGPSSVPFPLPGSDAEPQRQAIEMKTFVEVELDAPLDHIFCLAMASVQGGTIAGNGGPRLAHELCHVLGLEHRGIYDKERYSGTGEIIPNQVDTVAQDGLSYPPASNLMHPSSNLASKYHLDIIQALAIHGNARIGYDEGKEAAYFVKTTTPGFRCTECGGSGVGDAPAQCPWKDARKHEQAPAFEACVIQLVNGQPTRSV
jgi:hypothetical protein